MPPWEPRLLRRLVGLRTLNLSACGLTALPPGAAPLRVCGRVSYASGEGALCGPESQAAAQAWWACVLAQPVMQSCLTGLRCGLNPKCVGCSYLSSEWWVCARSIGLHR